MTTNSSDRCQRKSHGGFVCQHRRDEHTGWSGGQQVLCVHMHEGPGVRGLCSCPGFVEAETTPIPEPHECDCVSAAKSHLRVALAQTIPSDDQIIIGHVRDALRLLESRNPTLREQAARTVTEPIRQILQRPIAGKCVDIDGETWHQPGETCADCGFGILQRPPAAPIVAEPMETDTDGCVVCIDDQGEKYNCGQTPAEFMRILQPVRTKVQIPSDPFRRRQQ